MITDEQLAEIQHDLDTRQQMNLTEAAQILAGHTRTLLGAVEQLRYERRLLGACRRHLDEIADPEGRYTVEAVKTAGDLAQRIVDEIGHPVTDEPALGPEFRDRIAELERELEWAVAERDHALKQVKKPDYEKLVDAYLSGAKPVAEQLMQANEALARHGHDPIECGCELSTKDAAPPGGDVPVESAPAAEAKIADSIPLSDQAVYHLSEQHPERKVHPTPKENHA